METPRYNGNSKLDFKGIDHEIGLLYNEINNPEASLDMMRDSREIAGILFMTQMTHYPQEHRPLAQRAAHKFGEAVMNVVRFFDIAGEGLRGRHHSLANYQRNGRNPRPLI